MSFSLGSDSKLPQGRLAVVSYVIVGLTVLLLVGFWKLQVVDSTHYQELADRNRIRTIPLIAPRGRMLDRNGRVLVDNYASFSILLLRDDMKIVNRALPSISDALNVSIEDLRQQLETAKYLPTYEPIVIKPEASTADVAYIESHRTDLPMLEMVMMSRRRYPPAGFLSSAVGYVGEVSEAEIEKSDGKLRPGDMAGKSGLEKQYDSVLQGNDGLRRIIVNSVGKEMGRLEQIEPVPGKSIQLTIDYDVQAAAEAALGDKKGAVVAMNPETGEILAFVSRPSPDPNAFAVRVSKEEWQRLNSDPNLPLMDRVIQAQLAPGSVFKIVMATAMLETKAVPESFTAFCPGQASFYGRVYHCWQPKGHGTVDLEHAVAESCDVFFYNVGMRLGIDRMSYYGTQVGLGRRTGIDLPGEEPGLMPSAEWKERNYHAPWYPGENISVGVGQGPITTTPLQLARAIGGIALGGVFKTPHLLKSDQPAGEFRFPISEDTVDKVTHYMENVVDPTFPGGTAHVAYIKGVELCGKSGSAQVISAQGLAKVKNRSDYKDNAWFVGFAPRRNPEIVVSVLVQSTMLHGGEIAAPVVRDVVKAYFDKKNGNLKPPMTAVAAKVTPATNSIQQQPPTLAQSEPVPLAGAKPQASNAAGSPARPMH
ncbi:MAG TPA: penicillin-binding protein 2 [Candidatus Acidoferrales bacterium]|nr:penicillin-binding protein 2 [Candidatus Acidoferrales bacterium]